MIDLIRDAWRVIRRRDSESATLMTIGLAELMDVKDLRQMAEYFRTLAELKQKES